jgi:hypothetical protein
MKKTFFPLPGLRIAPTGPAVMGIRRVYGTGKMKKKGA